MSLTKFDRRVQDEPVVVYAPQPGEWDDAVRELWDKFVASEELFGLDVESTAVDDKKSAGRFAEGFRLRLVQFGNGSQAWVLRAGEHEAQIRQLLEDESKCFVSHTNYDVVCVWLAFGVALGQRAVDTHLMASLIAPGVTEDHGLKYLCSKYIDGGLEQADKDLHEVFKSIAPSGQRVGSKLEEFGWSNVELNDLTYLVYAGLDAIYVRRLWDELCKELGGFGRRAEMESWLAAQTTALTVRGVRLDREYTAKLAEQYQERNSSARRRLEDRMGCKATSPKRVDWLASRGVEFEFLTATGKPSLSAKDGLPDLVARYPDGEVGEMLRDTLELSETDNFARNLSLYPLFADSQGRVHPEIKTLAAHTGRMSIQRPALQTLKNGPLRGCFVADPGHVLVSCDFANVELRIAAALSADPELIKVFEDGQDVHSNTARLVFGDGFTKDDRRLAKALNFGTVFGGGAPGLSKQTGLGIDQARSAVKKFRESYPGLAKFGYRCSDFDWVPNDYGRLIPADQGRKYANSNYMIQSTARDMLVEALYRLLVLEGWSPFLWLLVHDEVILCVPEARAEEAKGALERCMSSSFLGVPITAEATVEGERWGSK